MSFAKLMAGLLAVVMVPALLAWEPIPDDLQLGSATVHLPLKAPWRAEKFTGGTPRIAYSLSNDNLRDGVAEFQIFRTRIPKLEDRSSLEAITDALVIGWKIDFSKAIFGEQTQFMRARDFVTKLPQREVYWYVSRKQNVPFAREASFVRVGVIVTPELFSEGVVYIVTGFEINDNRSGEARHFDMLDDIVKGLRLHGTSPAQSPPGKNDTTH